MADTKPSDELEKVADQTSTDGESTASDNKAESEDSSKQSSDESVAKSDAESSQDATTETKAEEAKAESNPGETDKEAVEVKPEPGKSSGKNKNKKANKSKETSSAAPSQAPEAVPVSESEKQDAAPEAASASTDAIEESAKPAAEAASSASTETDASLKADGQPVTATATATATKPEKRKAHLVDEPVQPENFLKDEVKTLLVPVPAMKRLIAWVIILVCGSGIAWVQLHGPIAVHAQGLHEVDLPNPGNYVMFFRGDLRDPYGWGVNGRFRQALSIELEPLEPQQRVRKIEPITDMSGANYFSVAEWEVNQGGKYSLWVKWEKEEDRCHGKIYIEKDPVEKFFLKWALGIVGAISLFYSIGIPLSNRRSLETLPTAGNAAPK